jgi:hypothetical protein
MLFNVNLLLVIIPYLRSSMLTYYSLLRLYTYVYDCYIGYFNVVPVLCYKFLFFFL